MKKIFSIALFAALMVSCNNFDIENEGVTPDGGATTGDAIEFYAEESTKTTYFEGEGLGVNWEEGDQIAVRLIDSNIVYPGTNDTTPDYRRRTNYTANSTGSTTEFTAIANNWTNGEMKWLPDTYEGVVKEGYEHLNGQPIDNNIVAYYPATNNASPNNVGITLPTSQTQAKAGDHSHIGDLMVMKTERMTWKAGEEKPARVGLKFRNVYSIIELTLKSNESGKQISKVEINSASTALTFSASSSVNFFTTFEEDDANGLKTASGATPSKGVKSVNTTLTEPAALTAEGAKIYFVVLPGEHANGDLTITAHFTDGTYIDQKMGSIKFEMNKVYRPEVTLNNFVQPSITPAAEVMVSGNDASKMFGTVNFENGSTFINSRTKINGHSVDLATYNIPEQFLYSETDTWQTMSMMNSLYPDLDVTVKTSGMVYLLVDGKDKDVNTNLTAAGWVAETPRYSADATDEQKTNFSSGAWDDTFPIFYVSALGTLENIAYFTIYSKKFEANETFNIATLMNDSSPAFRGARLVAKSIEWPVAEAEIQKTSALSDGALHTFEEGATIAEGHAAVIATKNGDNEKSIPTGYVGMDFFTVKRGSSTTHNCRTVTAKVTKSGMLYQIFPKNAQLLADIKPTGKDKYDGWRAVDYFHLGTVTANPFYISAKWVEAGEEITTFDYTSYIEEAGRDENNKWVNASKFNYYNTGIFMGKLTVKEVTE